MRRPIPSAKKNSMSDGVKQDINISYLNLSIIEGFKFESHYLFETTLNGVSQSKDSIYILTELPHPMRSDLQPRVFSPVLTKEKLKQKPTALAVSPNSNYLVIGYAKGEFIVYEIKTETLLYKGNVNCEVIKSIVFSEDSNSFFILSGTECIQFELRPFFASFQVSQVWDIKAPVRGVYSTDKKRSFFILVENTKCRLYINTDPKQPKVINLLDLYLQRSNENDFRLRVVSSFEIVNFIIYNNDSIWHYEFSLNGDNLLGKNLQNQSRFQRNFDQKITDAFIFRGGISALIFANPTNSSILILNKIGHPLRLIQDNGVTLALNETFIRFEQNQNLYFMSTKILYRLKFISWKQLIHFHNEKHQYNEIFKIAKNVYKGSNIQYFDVPQSTKERCVAVQNEIRPFLVAALRESIANIYEGDDEIETQRTVEEQLRIFKTAAKLELDDFLIGKKPVQIVKTDDLVQTKKKSQKIISAAEIYDEYGKRDFFLKNIFPEIIKLRGNSINRFEILKPFLDFANKEAIAEKVEYLRANPQILNATTRDIKEVEELTLEKLGKLYLRNMRMIGRYFYEISRAPRDHDGTYSNEVLQIIADRVRKREEELERKEEMKYSENGSKEVLIVEPEAEHNQTQEQNQSQEQTHELSQNKNQSQEQNQTQKPNNEEIVAEQPIPIVPTVSGGHITTDDEDSGSSSYYYSESSIYVEEEEDKKQKPDKPKEEPKTENVPKPVTIEDILALQENPNTQQTNEEQKKEIKEADDAQNGNQSTIETKEDKISQVEEPKIENEENKQEEPKNEDKVKTENDESPNNEENASQVEEKTNEDKEVESKKENEYEESKSETKPLEPKNEDEIEEKPKDVNEDKDIVEVEPKNDIENNEKEEQSKDEDNIEEESYSTTGSSKPLENEAQSEKSDNDHHAYENGEVPDIDIDVKVTPENQPEVPHIDMDVQISPEEQPVSEVPQIDIEIPQIEVHDYEKLDVEKQPETPKIQTDVTSREITLEDTSIYTPNENEQRIETEIIPEQKQDENVKIQEDASEQPKIDESAIEQQNDVAKIDPQEKVNGDETKQENTKEEDNQDKTEVVILEDPLDEEEEEHVETEEERLERFAKEMLYQENGPQFPQKTLATYYDMVKQLSREMYVYAKENDYAETLSFIWSQCYNDVISLCNYLYKAGKIYDFVYKVFIERQNPDEFDMLNTRLIIIWLFTPIKCEDGQYKCIRMKPLIQREDSKLGEILSIFIGFGTADFRDGTVMDIQKILYHLILILAECDYKYAAPILDKVARNIHDSRAEIPPCAYQMLIRWVFSSNVSADAREDLLMRIAQLCPDLVDLDKRNSPLMKHCIRCGFTTIVKKAVGKNNTKYTKEDYVTILETYIMSPDRRNEVFRFIKEPGSPNQEALCEAVFVDRIFRALILISNIDATEYMVTHDPAMKHHKKLIMSSGDKPDVVVYKYLSAVAKLKDQYPKLKEIFSQQEIQSIYFKCACIYEKENALNLLKDGVIIENEDEFNRGKSSYLDICIENHVVDACIHIYSLHTDIPHAIVLLGKEIERELFIMMEHEYSHEMDIKSIDRVPSEPKLKKANQNLDMAFQLLAKSPRQGPALDSIWRHLFCGFKLPLYLAQKDKYKTLSEGISLFFSYFIVQIIARSTPELALDILETEFTFLNTNQNRLVFESVFRYLNYQNVLSNNVENMLIVDCKSLRQDIGFMYSQANTAFDITCCSCGQPITGAGGIGMRIYKCGHCFHATPQCGLHTSCPKCSATSDDIKKGEELEYDLSTGMKKKSSGTRMTRGMMGKIRQLERVDNRLKRTYGRDFDERTGGNNVYFIQEYHNPKPKKIKMNVASTLKVRITESILEL